MESDSNLGRAESIVVQADLYVLELIPVQSSSLFFFYLLGKGILIFEGGSAVICKHPWKGIVQGIETSRAEIESASEQRSAIHSSPPREGWSPSQRLPGLHMRSHHLRAIFVQVRLVVA